MNEWMKDGHLSDEALSIAGDLEASRLSLDARGHLESCDRCMARLADEALLQAEVDDLTRRSRSRASLPIAAALALAAGAAMPAYLPELGRLSVLGRLPALVRAALASVKAVDLLATQAVVWLAALSLAFAASLFVLLSRSRKVAS